MLHTASVLVKFVTCGALALLFGATAGQALVTGILVGFLGTWADRRIPYEHQGVTRWAIDGGLAAVVLYLVGALPLWWGAGRPLPPLSLVYFGAACGLAELSWHRVWKALAGDGGPRERRKE